VRREVIGNIELSCEARKLPEMLRQFAQAVRFDCQQYGHLRLREKRLFRRGQAGNRQDNGGGGMIKQKGGAFMSSDYSRTYYTRFLFCLEHFLERKVKEREKYISKEPGKLLVWDGTHPGSGNPYHLKLKEAYAAIRFVLDALFEKAPSASMGADDWLDKFFINADDILCPGMWCKNERCEDHVNNRPYYCDAKLIPSKCEKWKAWRLVWRSYPDNEACQKCKHYKPESPSRYRTELQTKQINEYKCYCRAKELPDGCPKRRKERSLHFENP
jgi:hypothetical protein